jgi:hypothetical protein
MNLYLIFSLVLVFLFTKLTDAVTINCGVRYSNTNKGEIQFVN